MRSACAICERPIDLLLAPPAGSKVICKSCRAKAPTATPTVDEPPPLDAAPPTSTPDPVETPPSSSKRKPARASFWLGDDELAKHDRVVPAPAAKTLPSPRPAPRTAGDRDSSIEDLKRLAPASFRPPPRPAEDLFDLRAEYFGKDGPTLEAPDLGPAPSERAAPALEPPRLAPTVDLFETLSTARAPSDRPAGAGPAGTSHRRAALGISAGVLIGVLLTLGASQLLRTGDAPTSGSSGTSSGAARAPSTKPAGPADSASPSVAVEAPIQALTPGAKAHDVPAPSAAPAPADATAASNSGPAPVAASTAGASGARREDTGREPSAKDSHPTSEPAAAEPAAPAQPSEADALMAAQRAALSAPKAAGFSRSAAGAALAAAAGQAAACKKEGDPSGMAKVSVTFAPSGRVTSSQLVGGPFVGSAAGGCIARAFRSAHVPAFEGDPVTVQKSVDLR